MRLVVFGLGVSSTWGNGHATLWRGLIRALVADRHHVTFFERDTDYYAAHRDLTALPDGAELLLYPDWPAVSGRAAAAVAEADAVVITSYCPDAGPAHALARDGRALRVFYDLDTPVTFARLSAGETVSYLPANGLGEYDLVLSYTGGASLDALRGLGARRVAPLYGSVDPALHAPGTRRDAFAADLSYIGTYAADRQGALERLFVAPARARASSRFVLAGAQYPPDFPWADNIWFVRHLPAADHPDFHASCRLTLNVTRGPMARTGWCPSGRLFEAASCGAPILSDAWPGLDTFFSPGEDILVADTTEDALAALDLPDTTLRAIAARARDRVLGAHTAAHRARELVGLLSAPASTPVRRAA